MSSQNTSSGNYINVGAPGYVAVLADLTGASEPALRLLLSILAGYPLAALHRAFVRNLAPIIQHIFFAVSGFLLCIFNYGYDSYHSVIAIWITYLLARLLHHVPKHLLIINFAFHMGYLLIGYCFTESNNYDIIWTMPHCVLVLRLIGFGFDVADGQKPREQLSNDQKETALSHVPPLIELTAYTFFPASFLVGPQFPFRRYQRFIQGEFNGHSGSVRAGIVRGGLGVLYLAARQLGAIMLPDSYLLTDAFRNQSTLRKLIEIGLWGKISLYKYISCWLLAEGALMCTGNSNVPYFIVGDEGFPLKTYFLTPFSGRYLDDNKYYFNKRLSRARRVVENAFGILAARWRIYHRTIIAEPNTVDIIIKATVVLHNVLCDSI